MKITAVLVDTVEEFNEFILYFKKEEKIIYEGSILLSANSDIEIITSLIEDAYQGEDDEENSTYLFDDIDPDDPYSIDEDDR